MQTLSFGNLYTVTLTLPVTTDVQNPSVRYVNNSVNLTCVFAEGSTAEGCLFNFTGPGINTQQSFFVNRSGDSSIATSCESTREFANNTDYMWSASDTTGGISIVVELILVDEDNFECGSGWHCISNYLL